MSVPKLDQQTETTMKQFREFLLSYNKLSEMCFTDCVHDFTTRKVLDSEVTGHSPVPMVNLTMRFRFTTRKGYSHFHRLPDVKTKVDPFDDFSKPKLYNELHGQIPEDHTAHISEVPRDSDATERIRKSPLIDSIAPQVPPDTLG